MRLLFFLNSVSLLNQYSSLEMPWGLDLFPVEDLLHHVPDILKFQQDRHDRMISLLTTRVNFVDSFAELLLLGRNWESLGYSKQALKLISDRRSVIRMHDITLFNGP